jgi:hypothetical protein
MKRLPMMRSAFYKTVLASFLIFLGMAPGFASAQTNIVVIRAAGKAYEGAPKLQLLADGRLIGERTLAQPLETSAKKPSIHQERQIELLQFSVPDLDRVRRLDIRFANPDTSGERHLLIYWVSIDGYGFRPRDMTLIPEKSGGIYQRQAMLWGQGVLRLHKPEIGWKKSYKGSAPAPP